jgi:hypothetical protein
MPNVLEIFRQDRFVKEGELTQDNKLRSIYPARNGLGNRVIVACGKRATTIICAIIFRIILCLPFTITAMHPLFHAACM